MQAHGPGAAEYGSSRYGRVCISKNVGWILETIPCKDLEYGKIMHSDIHSIGLVLLE